MEMSLGIALDACLQASNTYIIWVVSWKGISRERKNVQQLLITPSEIGQPSWQKLLEIVCVVDKSQNNYLVKIDSCQDW